MNFSAKFDEIAISDRLKDIQSLVRRGLVDPELGTLSKQGQLLAEHCMKLTPPRNLKQGENAVARDISRVVVKREQGYLESVYNISGTETNVRQYLRNKKGQTYLVDIDEIDLTGGKIAGWHKARRDSRGRVLRATSKSNDKTIGRWRADNVLWAPAGEVESYIKLKQAVVGFAKAGWLKGYLALGGKRVSEWVARHGQNKGQFIDGRSAPNPSVTVRNVTAWGAKNDEAERITANAIAARARAMKSYFENICRLASEGKPTQWQTQARTLERAA